MDTEAAAKEKPCKGCIQATQYRAEISVRDQGIAESIRVAIATIGEIRGGPLAELNNVYESLQQAHWMLMGSVPSYE